MKGSHRIIVESRKVKYDFTVKRNNYDSDRRQRIRENGFNGADS